MKDIKKYMTTLAAAGLVMAVVAPSHATFVSKSSTTLVASATTGGTPVVSITSALIKNITGNGVVGAIGWTGATSGGGWKVADQYVELKTNITTSNGGIQYYTDNTHASASPRFPPAAVSSFTATPAGLVDNVDLTQKLPTAWRASTFTLTGVSAIDPNALAGESFLWFFHEDKAQVAVPDLNAGDFNNGDAYITVYAAPGSTLGTPTGPVTVAGGGIHFAQAPTEFGGFHLSDTTYLYTEADFSTALAARIYSTNRLILEAYTL